MPAVTLITGGGTGIGAACAARMAGAGSRVAVMGRRPAPLAQVSAATGTDVLVGNAANTEDMRRALAELLERHGRLDTLICCAGGLGMGRAGETSDTDWAQAMEANLHSAFVAVRECLPALIASRGSIVLVASIAALAAGPAACSYVTAKHALLGLTRSLARDYGPQGVRVNAVCPGWVRTPMADEEMQELMERHGVDLDGAYRLATADTPLRRAAEPEEVAAVCQFLASPDASYVTGATLVVDGGATIVDVPTLVYER